MIIIFVFLVFVLSLLLGLIVHVFFLIDVFLVVVTCYCLVVFFCFVVFCYCFYLSHKPFLYGRPCARICC